MNHSRCQSSLLNTPDLYEPALSGKHKSDAVWLFRAKRVFEAEVKNASEVLRGETACNTIELCETPL